MAGRYAPSPSGDLHLGNLRTALVAWLSARADGVPFLLRMDDLDQVNTSPEHAVAQSRDLAAIGLDWDGDVVFQSERTERHREAIAELERAGLTYPCYCSRREIREAASAPQALRGAVPEGAYPGTCRELTDSERRRRSEQRPPALRLRTDGEAIAVEDEVAGRYVGRVDDVVLQRNDGVPAYNLAVVVDDGDQGVTQVVRGDDLLASTPRQMLLGRLLGVPTPRYLHVPLVVGPDGHRLAKRDGAVTLAELAALDVDPPRVRAALVRSLGLAEPGEGPSNDELVARFRRAGPPALAGDAVPLASMTEW